MIQARPHVSRVTVLVIGLLLAAVGVGGLVVKNTLSGPPSDTEIPYKGLPAVGKAEVYLYFGDLHGHGLKAEQRVMNRRSDEVEFCRQLIDALVLGPQKEGGRTLPEKARIRTLFIKGGTAYVDFVSDAFEEHPGGVGTELLSIYSIVNTLVVNVEVIQSVKILIDGRESPTLAGHVDLQQKYVANMMWIR